MDDIRNIFNAGLTELRGDDELLHMIREKIRNLDTEKYEKSSTKAGEFRQNGNNLFGKKDYHGALKAYNEAIINAPFIAATTDHSDHSHELSLAFGNRSAVLYYLKRFTESLEDIESALEFGYPKKSRTKLHKRKQECLKEMSKDNKESLNGQREGYGQLAMKSPNASLSAASEAIEPFVTEDKGAGRGLKATQRIAKGDIIFLEKPHVSILSPKHYGHRCYHCLRRLLIRCYPCRSCIQIRYCGQACAESSWTQYHRWECRYIDLFRMSDEFVYEPNIAVRILLKEGIINALNRAVNSDDTFQEKFYTDCYSSVLSLVEHKEDSNSYLIPSTILLGFILEKVLQDDVILSRKNREILEKLPIKHLRQAQVNSITIYDVHEEDVGDGFRFEEEQVGCGLYLTFRLVNHSCDSNIRVGFIDGDTLIGRASRDIAAGEEIYHTYGAHYNWQIVSIRRKMLKQSYYFDCNCSACKRGLQPINKAFLCPNCEGAVVCDGQCLCLACGQSDHLDLQEILANAEECYKLVKMGSRCLTDEVNEDQDYHASNQSAIHGSNKLLKELARNQAIPKEIQLEICEKALSESYKLLSKLLYKTHKELSSIAEKLSLCYIRLERFDAAVRYANKKYDAVKAEFGEEDVHSLNSLLKVIECQRAWLSQMRSSHAKDSNKYKLVTKDYLDNVHNIESIIPYTTSTYAQSQFKLYKDVLLKELE